MDYNKFQIKEFDLNLMVPNPSILIIAKRGSGKSYIVREIMNHFKNIPAGVVISPCDRMSSFYKYFFPDLYVHYDLGNNLLKKILIRQSIMIDKAKANKTIDPTAMLIMDCCLAQKKSWTKDQDIMEILMNGRHYRLPYIATLQTPVGITPEMRLNFDYIFLLKEDSCINKKKLWNDYASMFPTLDSFNKVFSKCTEDYRAMVIDNRKPTDNIQEKVFWFKAQEQKFTFGCDKFKEIHRNYYEPNWAKNVLVENSQFAFPHTNEEISIEFEDNYFDYFINEKKLKLLNNSPEGSNFPKTCFRENNDITVNSKHESNLLSDSDDASDSNYPNDLRELTEFNHEELITEYNPDRYFAQMPIQSNCPNEEINLAYDDQTYKLSAKINYLCNHKLIEILCRHIENLKKIK